ncbi:MAG: helix-turn-helix domain-containing protein [Geminicoccaceae bacterium]
MKARPPKRSGPSRPRAQQVDRHIGARIRERRTMLGLTQKQMAEIIGVTFQQAHKYEKGVNLLTAGRLYALAHALGVEVSYFFEGMDGSREFELNPRQRMLLDLTRNFISLPSREHQKAVCELARILAGDEDLPEPGERSIAS